MGRYALRSACRDECTCGGGVKHGRVEKKKEVVVRPKRMTTVEKKADPQDAGSKGAIQPRPRRKTTVVTFKSDASSGKEAGKTAVETRARRKTTMITKSNKKEEEEKETRKSKTSGSRRTVAPKGKEKKGKDTVGKEDTEEKEDDVEKKNTVKEEDSVEKDDTKEKEDTVEDKKDTVGKREKSLEKKLGTIEMNTEEKETIVKKENSKDEEQMEWTAEDYSQSIIEEEENRKEETKDGAEKAESSLYVFRPPVNAIPRRVSRKLEFPPNLPTLDVTPIPSYKFRAPIKDQLNETRRREDWNTAHEEDLSSVSSLDLSDQLLMLTSCEEKEREDAAMRELEREMEEFDRKHIDHRAIIDRLAMENRNLRKTIFEMKNKEEQSTH